MPETIVTPDSTSVTSVSIDTTKKTATKLAEDLRDLKISPETKEAMARYLPYLEEAQRRLIITVVVFVGTIIVAAVFYKPIMIFVLSHFNLKGINMVFTSPLQFFEVAIQIGMYFGLMTAFPLLLYNLISFLKPALKPHEFDTFRSMVPISIGLFGLGFFFGAWVEQFVVSMFSGATTGTPIMNIWDVSRFFSDIMVMGLLMGLIFQFPIILHVLMRFKILKRSQLSKWRLQIYCGSVVIAILMPPQDVLSDVILSLPLVVFYEIALLLNRDQKD